MFSVYTVEHEVDPCHLTGEHGIWVYGELSLICMLECCHEVPCTCFAEFMHHIVSFPLNTKNVILLQIN